MTGTTTMPPSAVGRKFVRYVLHFGVGVAVGLAPFLGKVKIKGFDALLELYPRDMQQYLIPLSGILLGMVAVAVEFYSQRPSPVALLRRHFRTLFVSLLGALLLLVVLYHKFVVPVSMDKDRGHTSFVVGWSRSPDCICKSKDDATCLAEITFNPALHELCWSHLRDIKLVLTITYLFLVGGFGSLVGLLLLPPAPEPGPATAAARPRARPSPRVKAGAGTKPEPSPGAKGKPASPRVESEPVRSAKPKPSPGSEKRPGTRRRRPPSPPEGPPEA